MVPAGEARALHAMVRADLGPKRGGAVLRAAGVGTGRYLLAHRIPRAAQILFRALPAPLSSRLLIAAIRRNAWTFGVPAGLGVHRRNGLCLTIAANPLSLPEAAAAPRCDFYAATFETLFQHLVAPTLTVIETACRAQGEPACCFRVEQARPLP